MSYCLPERCVFVRIMIKWLNSLFPNSLGFLGQLVIYQFWLVSYSHIQWVFESTTLSDSWVTNSFIWLAAHWIIFFVPTLLVLDSDDYKSEGISSKYWNNHFKGNTYIFFLYFLLLINQVADWLLTFFTHAYKKEVDVIYSGLSCNLCLWDCMSTQSLEILATILFVAFIRPEINPIYNIFGVIIFSTYLEASFLTHFEIVTSSQWRWLPMRQGIFRKVILWICLKILFLCLYFLRQIKVRILIPVLWRI